MSRKPSGIHIDVNDRVHLTEVRATDAAAFVEHLNDQEIYDNTLRIPHPYTEEDAYQFLDHTAMATARHNAIVNFAIRTRDGGLIGGCGFDSLCYEHWAEIGYWLAKPYWGQGIMTDVVRAACSHAIAQWKVVRLTAHVFAHNKRSARVLEKAGFEFEGELRKHHRKKDAFIDSHLYAKIMG